MKEIKIIHRYDTDFAACIDNDGDIIVSSVNTLLENIDNENFQLVTGTSNEKLIEDYIQACIELKSIRQKIQEKYDMNCEEFHLKPYDIFPETIDEPGKDGKNYDEDIHVPERVPDAGKTTERYYPCFYQMEPVRNVHDDKHTMFHCIHFGNPLNKITCLTLDDLLYKLKDNPKLYTGHQEEYREHVDKLKEENGTENIVYNDNGKLIYNELMFSCVYDSVNNRIIHLLDFQNEMLIKTWRTNDDRWQGYSKIFDICFTNMSTEEELLKYFRDFLVGNDNATLIKYILESKKRDINCRMFEILNGTNEYMVDVNSKIIHPNGEPLPVKDVEEKKYYKCFFREKNGPSNSYKLHFGDKEKEIERKTIQELLFLLEKHPSYYTDSKEQCDKYISDIERKNGTNRTIYSEGKYKANELCFVSVYCPNDGRIYTIDDFTGQVKLLTWTENGKHHAYCHRLGYTMQNWDKESKMIDSFNVSLEAKDYGDIIISILKSKQKPMPTNIPKRAIQRIVSIHDKKVSN